LLRSWVFSLLIIKRCVGCSFQVSFLLIGN
jgi:hypothetical protein